MTNRRAEVARLFVEVGIKVRHSLRGAFEDKGITMPQGMVIGLLHNQNEVKITELSEKLGLSNSTVSGIVDRLERQQIVERVRSQEDRRIVYVRLTGQFSEVHRNFLRFMEENFTKLIDNSTTEEVETIIKGLETLNRLLGDKSEKE